jgi:ethanolamine-phosphate cytidylyltransferase
MQQHTLFPLKMNMSAADVPYELHPAFVEDLFTKHRIDYIIHGDDPCLLPDGTDAYAHAKKLGRFKMVSQC